jgi:hypothetical protein
MIKFKYDNVDYSLGFNRKTALATEKLGFNVSKAEELPLNSLLSLFRGSFLLNHPMISEEKVYEIFGKIGNRAELEQALLSEYVECLSSLMIGENEGNVEWTKE